LKVRLPNLRDSNLEEYELIESPEKVYRFRKIEKERIDQIILSRQVSEGE